MSTKKVDPSTVEPVNRCTAHRRNGDPCKNAAIRASNVCRVHGGSAPQVRRAAQVRLLMAADRIMGELVKIATDEKQPAPVRLAAIWDALDRAGLAAAQEVNVSVSKMEQVAGVVFVDDFGDDDVVEAEVVEFDAAAAREGVWAELEPGERIAAEREHNAAEREKGEREARPVPAPLVPRRKLSKPAAEPPLDVLSLARDGRTRQQRIDDDMAEAKRREREGRGLAAPDSRSSTLDYGPPPLRPRRPRQR